MFRRFGFRLCVTPHQAAVAAAAASAAPTATSAAAAPPLPPTNVRKPRSFEASEEEPAATVAHNAHEFPPPPPYQHEGDAPLSAAAKRKIEIVNEIGDEAFDENTKVLKNIALRGLRSGLIIVVGVVTFAISLKKKKQRDAAFDEDQGAQKEKVMDPTQRYLEEMSGLGFDTEQGEQDAAEAKKALELRNKQAKK